MSLSISSCCWGLGFLSIFGDCVKKCQLKSDIFFSESVKILETQDELLGTRVKMCKKNSNVQSVVELWKHYSKEEPTWEKEDDLKAKFPRLFDNLSKSPG